MCRTPMRFSSCVMIPPEEATMGVQPFSFSADAISIVPRSTPPPCRLGRICNTVGRRLSTFGEEVLWSGLILFIHCIINITEINMAAPDTPSMLPRPDGQSLAYYHTPGFSPGVIFCPGFMSDMEGTKALALEKAMTSLHRSYTRFDYMGHGRSTGSFTDGTISRWTDDALAILDNCTAGPQIIVGSSMGGWIGLRMALLRPERIAGFVGIAAAPDFTARMWEDMPPEGRAAIEKDGFWAEPSEYSDEPYIITRRLLDDGPRNYLLNG